MSDLQKRFEAQRQKLLKTVPKNSRIVEPKGSLKLPKAWLEEENRLNEEAKRDNHTEATK